VKQMARFIAEKARIERHAAGDGPAQSLRAPHRHLAIAEDPTVTSESIGDAFMKTVIISVKR
jgi:hypothetical protein